MFYDCLLCALGIGFGVDILYAYVHVRAYNLPPPEFKLLNTFSIKWSASGACQPCSIQ